MALHLKVEMLLVVVSAGSADVVVAVLAHLADGVQEEEDEYGDEHVEIVDELVLQAFQEPGLEHLRVGRRSTSSEA